ncbi:AEC family transporter [uncultured Acinetobacter sp.]|uniref:AEC family transporter n=1 Tax=uncultured Acinetobacter sp. TaxID=165433 RepID=UPI00261BECDD|nr:AEC family transporter [uncultured Acinetobacter sp.]
MALLPLICLLALGYTLRRSKFLSAEFWAGAERLNYFILFPALLFNNLAFVELSLKSLTWVLLTMLLTIALVSAGFWVLKHIFAIRAEQFAVYVQSHIRFNTYIGLALVGSLFGSDGVKMFAMMIATAIPTVNIISLLAFSQQNSHWTTNGLAVLKNPLILGCLAGVLFNLTGFKLLSGIEDLIRLLANVSLPLGLLAVGAALQFQALKQDIWRLGLNSVGRLIVVPLIAYAVAQLLALSQFESLVITLFFALPTASSSYILTRYLNGDYKLMAGVISLQTLLFVLSFPGLMYILEL